MKRRCVFPKRGRINPVCERLEHLYGVGQCFGRSFIVVGSGGSAGFNALLVSNDPPLP